MLAIVVVVVIVVQLGDCQKNSSYITTTSLPATNYSISLNTSQPLNFSEGLVNMTATPSSMVVTSTAEETKDSGQGSDKNATEVVSTTEITSTTIQTFYFNTEAAMSSTEVNKATTAYATKATTEAPTKETTTSYIAPTPVSETAKLSSTATPALKSPITATTSTPAQSVDKVSTVDAKASTQSIEPTQSVKESKISESPTPTIVLQQTTAEGKKATELLKSTTTSKPEATVSNSITEIIASKTTTKDSKVVVNATMKNVSPTKSMATYPTSSPVNIAWTDFYHNCTSVCSCGRGWGEAKYNKTRACVKTGDSVVITKVKHCESDEFGRNTTMSESCDNCQCSNNAGTLQVSLILLFLTTYQIIVGI